LRSLGPKEASEKKAVELYGLVHWKNAAEVSVARKLKNFTTANIGIIMVEFYKVHKSFKFQGKTLKQGTLTPMALLSAFKHSELSLRRQYL